MSTPSIRAALFYTFEYLRMQKSVEKQNYAYVTYLKKKGDLNIGCTFDLV